MVPQRPEPPPSPSLSIRDRMGSLRRIINPGNRPLPDTPKQKPGTNNCNQIKTNKQIE